MRYSAETNGQLKDNEAHMFAMKHALSVYGSSSIYSLIPKNACSTMRLSISIRNGFLSRPEQAQWVIQNSLVFRADLREVASARYSFVVLRCPYSRLASCFFDKFLRATAPSAKYRQLVESGDGLRSLTFTKFCKSLRQKHVFLADPHWRPQVDFLVYREYDDIFAVERLSDAAAPLKLKADLELIDSRPHARHDAAQFSKLDRSEDCSGLTVPALQKLKATGILPHPASIYSDEAREVVSKLYAEDVALFARYFPGLGLFEENAAARPTPPGAARIHGVSH